MNYTNIYTSDILIELPLIVSCSLTNKCNYRSGDNFIITTFFIRACLGLNLYI